MNREEVIDWLEEIKVKYIHGGDQRYEECRITAIDKAVEELKKPEIKWIPTSERLPEKSGQYLVMGKGKYWISELMILQPIGVKGWCSACGNPQIEAWAYIDRKAQE